MSSPSLQAMRMKLILTLALALSTTAALADRLPVTPQIIGSCPDGYSLINGVCVPSPREIDFIPMPASGSCPDGWLSSGSYCLRIGR
jgi:CC domain